MNTKLNSNQIIIGVNWGAIHEKGWFESTQLVGVDLDMCCFLIDVNKTTKKILNWENTSSIWSSISSDDMQGDMEGNDQKDNEWLTINLNQINPNCEIHVTISNYSEKSMQKLSHFDYRIYSGRPNEVLQRFYFKNLKEISICNNAKGLYLGCIKNTNGMWQFNTCETPLEVCDAEEQIEEILNLNKV